MGSFAACIVLVATAPRDSVGAYATTHHGIAAITQWLLMPALGIVTISGLLAIVANPVYIDAGWAWIKALLGLSMFEGTLLTVVGTAHRIADLLALPASAASDPAELKQVLHTEWMGLWTLLVLSLANIVLAVWRPRFGPREGQ
jgi:uncharacterized membrane protein YbhN (UPF0104 family)